MQRCGCRSDTTKSWCWLWDWQSSGHGQSHLVPLQTPGGQAIVCHDTGDGQQRQPQAVLQRRILKDFWRGFCKESMIGQEHLSVVHYTRPGSCIERPSLKWLATQCHVNWRVVNPKSSNKIMDPVSSGFFPLRRFFVATLNFQGAWLRPRANWQNIWRISYKILQLDISDIESQYDHSGEYAYL